MYIDPQLLTDAQQVIQRLTAALQQVPGSVTTGTGTIIKRRNRKHINKQAVRQIIESKWNKKYGYGN